LRVYVWKKTSLSWVKVYFSNYAYQFMVMHDTSQFDTGLG